MNRERSRRRILASLSAGTVLGLAGCLGAPEVGGSDGGTDPGGSPTTAVPGDREYESYVFDHAGRDRRVLEGGLAYVIEENGHERYAALITDESGADRFDRELLRSMGEEAAVEFVDATDFGVSYLVVYQVFPHSSVPDHRVTDVTVADDAVEVGVDDTSEGGTDDITLETVIVRIERGDGPPPSGAVVVDEDGATTRSG